MVPPRLRLTPLRCPQRGCNSRRGIVTRAAGEGPRGAGIDGQCESSREADSRRNDSHDESKEAEAVRRSPRTSALPDIDDFDARRRCKLHAPFFTSDFLDASRHAPSRLLELKLSVFRFVLARACLATLELDEQPACLVPRRDERKRACDEQSEQNEVDAHHGRTPTALQPCGQAAGNGASVRSATRKTALRERGLRLSSSIEGFCARPIFRSSTSGNADERSANRAMRGSPPKGCDAKAMKRLTMRSSSE